MKKILFSLALIVATSLAANAQTATAFSQTATNSTGAYSNTGVDTVTVTVTQYWRTVSIQPVVTKVSGTVAGTAILYATVNGTNYVATGDTLTCTNQTTNSALWSKTDPSVAKYRILFTGSGTMAATGAATILGRKP